MAGKLSDKFKMAIGFILLPFSLFCQHHKSPEFRLTKHCVLLNSDMEEEPVYDIYEDDIFYTVNERNFDSSVVIYIHNINSQKEDSLVIPFTADWLFNSNFTDISVNAKYILLNSFKGLAILDRSTQKVNYHPGNKGYSFTRLHRLNDSLFLLYALMDCRMCKTYEKNYARVFDPGNTTDSIAFRFNAELLAYNNLVSSFVDSDAESIFFSKTLTPSIYKHNFRGEVTDSIHLPLAGWKPLLLDTVPGKYQSFDSCDAKSVLLRLKDYDKTITRIQKILVLSDSLILVSVQEGGKKLKSLYLYNLRSLKITSGPFYAEASFREKQKNFMFFIDFSPKALVRNGEIVLANPYLPFSKYKSKAAYMLKVERLMLKDKKVPYALFFYKVDY